jgi:Ser/Thr protein kinase RdoA (MazF antagonist)
VNVTKTRDLVRAHFTGHAAEWNLRPELLRVEYVPSPGGFGPMNFAVLDGRSAYHVKLSETPGQLSAWMGCAERLAAKYRAPRLLARMEIAGRQGAVFERLPGETPDRSMTTPVFDEIVALLNVLHGDAELAALLDGAARSARNTLLDYHITMCEEDLDEMDGSLPLPFVDGAAVTWMREEMHALRRLALSSTAFDAPVSSPIHGDLWFGNVLVDGARWWIIDWDDLKIGDPAHDLSLLLFTEIDGPAAAARWLRGRDAAFTERFHLYARAALLTFVIDPIADWIAAQEFPDVRNEARRHREALHRWALDRYRAMYGGPG